MAAMDHFNDNPIVNTWSYKLKKGPPDMSQIKETMN